MPVKQTPKQLNDLDAQILTNFEINYEDISSNKEINWLPTLSFEEKTSKREVTQRFIADHANIEETNFGQPPTYHTVEGVSSTIDLQIFDDALQMSAYDISEDSTGQLMRSASDLGKRAALHPKDLAALILENGETAAYTIYDGQPFFSNTHPKGDGTYNVDNLMAGTLDTTNYQAVRTAMRRFASDVSATDYYGIAPTHTIVPPDLEVTISQILNNSLLPLATWNTENAVLKGSSTAIIENRLTDVNDWFVASTELGVNPFIVIKHSDFGDFTLHSEISDDDPAFRDHHMRRWWIRAVMTVWPTRPETMIKVVN